MKDSRMLGTTALEGGLLLRSLDTKNYYDGAWVLSLTKRTLVLP